MNRKKEKAVKILEKQALYKFLFLSPFLVYICLKTATLSMTIFISRWIHIKSVYSRDGVRGIDSKINSSVCMCVLILME